MKIRNIVFDLGCVLVGLDKKRCVEAFRQVGLEKVAYYVNEHRCEDFFHDVEIGKINTHEFCEAIRLRTNTEISDERIVWAWNQLLTGIAEVKLAKLQALQGKYRLFILSNTNPMHWDLCKKEFLRYDGKGADEMFEKVFLSYRMHQAKPDKEIYETMLKEGNMKAEETLFIDDSRANIEAAVELGIQTILSPNDEWIELLP